MVSKPDDSTPARPVPAAEHEDPAKDRQKPDEANPEQLIIQRRLDLELAGVVREPDPASGDEQPTDDRDGVRTFVHATPPF